MKQQLRINFVLPWYTAKPIGGYRVVYEYADFLAAQGHKVSILFPRRLDPPANPVRFDSLRRNIWGLNMRLRNRPLIPWHTLNSKVRIMLKPDLGDDSVPDADATIATGWQTAHPVAALSPAKGRKFYLIQHHEIWAGPEPLVNETWHLPLRKIVISKWLEDLGAQMGAGDIRHIPNGINLDRFRIVISPDIRPMSILSMYHRESFKGVSDALAALHLYHERYPHIPISMFGVHDRLSDMPDWITYFQNPSQEQLVQDIYNRHAVYLGASLAEGWALPPAEAMACGCAFVGTDSGGNRDYATHGETALLSPPGDRDGLFRNLVSITENPQLRRTIQSNGTSNIRTFTWERAGTALEKYLLE